MNQLMCTESFNQCTAQSKHTVAHYFIFFYFVNFFHFFAFTFVAFFIQISNSEVVH